MKELKSSIISLNLKTDEESIVAFLGHISRETYPQLEKDVDSFLHDKELQYFSTRKFEKRKKDYLTGCYVAKSVVAEYLNETDLAAIEIESGLFNQPVVKYEGWNIPGVSLSHSHEWSAALSFPLGHPMGLDIEKLDFQKLDILKSQMTEYEIDLIQESGMDKSEGYCQIWTMKEALSKVLGCGLTVPFSVLEIAKPRFQKNGKGRCYFKNFGQYKCHSWIIKGYALSIVLPKKTEINLDIHALFSFPASRHT
jgi:phosphopantetheinyl transferase